MQRFNFPNIRFKHCGLLLCSIMIVMLFAFVGIAAINQPPQTGNTIKVNDFTKGHNVVTTPTLTVSKNTITGTYFDKNTKLDLAAVYTEQIPVKKIKDEYYYSKDYSMVVSDKNSIFTITVSNVKTFTVTVRPNYWCTKRLSYTRSYTPNKDGVATVTTNDLIPLKYKVNIDGKSKDKNSVTLAVQDKSTITTNKNGEFTYDIGSLPAGTYTIDLSGKKWSLVVGKKNSITPLK